MSKVRGFRVGKRLIQLSRWILRKIQIRTLLGYHRLSDRDVSRSPITKLLKWGRKLKCRLKVKSKSGQSQLESRSDPTVPKGHLAVYVGQKDSDGEVHRVLIPVIYFNHPLFGELLKEAEQEFGFHHEGGITIPCRFTEFERVKTRIASGSCRITRRKKLAWL